MGQKRYQPLELPTPYLVRWHERLVLNLSKDFQAVRAAKPLRAGEQQVSRKSRTM
jgi:hypothetical protein